MISGLIALFENLDIAILKMLWLKYNSYSLKHHQRVSTSGLKIA